MATLIVSGISRFSIFKPAPQSRAAGFTLLELLIVMVIAGLTLGMISLSTLQNDQQVLQNEAQTIALLFQLARDEAIVRNRPVAFEADSERYRFLIREENGWNPFAQDEMFREREFKRSPIGISVTPRLSDGAGPVRIVFGREPVDKPFVMTLAIGDKQAAIHADGIGHYTVE